MSSAIDSSKDSCGSRGMQNQVQFLFAYSSTDPSLKNTKKTLYSCKTCGIILCNLDEGGEFNTWPLLPAPLHSCSQPHTARGCSPEESAQAKVLINVALQHTDPRRVLGLLLWETCLLIKRGKEFRGQLERFGQVPTEDTWNEWNWMN